MKKKDKIISLELQVQTLTALLAEYVVKDAMRKVPVPKYKLGSENKPKIVCDIKPTDSDVINAVKEQLNDIGYFVADGKKTPLPPTIPIRVVNSSCSVFCEECRSTMTRKPFLFGSRTCDNYECKTHLDKYK